MVIGLIAIISITINYESFLSVNEILKQTHPYNLVYRLLWLLTSIIIPPVLYLNLGYNSCDYQPRLGLNSIFHLCM